MKKTVRLLALTLVFVMLLMTLASCGSAFGGIKANFEKYGYELKNTTSGTINIDGEAALTYSIHTFSPKKQESGNGSLGDLIGGVASAISSAIVWEFASSGELDKALENSETLAGLLKDAQKSSFVNGNCVLITLNENAVNIFNGKAPAN